MSKVCKQCGVKHAASAKTCLACGAKFDDYNAFVKIKKMVILLFLAIILIVCATVLSIILTGPKAATYRLMKHYTNNRPYAVIETFPQFLLDSERYEIKQFEAGIKQNVTDLSEYIVSFNIEKANNPTSQEYDELMDAFRYYGGDNFMDDDITDIKVIWVNYKGNVPSVWPSHSVRFIMIKYNGEWCWWPDPVNR